MTLAGTRVTWFVLGVCVGIVLAVVGMAGIAEAASRTAPDTVPAQSGTPLPDDTRMGLLSSPETFVGGRETRPSGSGSGVPLTPKRPTAALAGPLISGEATWCAPTLTQCQNWTNGRLLGAVHSFRWGDDPYRVRVWRGERSVTVTVLSHCACLNRHDTIDLSTAAFSKLADLSLGRIAVNIERVK